MSSRRMKSKFKKVYLEIDKIESKIFRKEGFLFFKSHVFSIEELLNSPEHQKIESITKKIGDDTLIWSKLGRLSQDEEEAYYDEKDKVDDELKRLNRKISEREPTWWEEVKTPLIKFVEIIASNLPDELKVNLISFIKKIIPKSLPFLDKTSKMLPFNK